MRQSFLISIFLLLSVTGQAQSCLESVINQKILDGALYLETLNGGGRPLTTEVYSLSSQFDTYMTIFSYSGVQSTCVQSTWKVKVNSEFCRIDSISKVK